LKRQRLTPKTATAKTTPKRRVKMDDAMVIHAEYVYASLSASNEHVCGNYVTVYPFKLHCCVLGLSHVTSSWSEVNMLILLCILNPFLSFLSYSVVVDHC
jgi:hypothetical protein